MNKMPLQILECDAYARKYTHTMMATAMASTPGISLLGRKSKTSYLLTSIVNTDTNVVGGCFFFLSGKAVSGLYDQDNSKCFIFPCVLLIKYIIS